MKRSILLFAALISIIGQRAWADVRPLAPGEATIYETVNPAHSGLTPAQIAASDRGFFSQITGNALSEEGDEVLMDKGNFVGDNPNGFPRAAYRRVTNIAIGTQTFDNSGTLEYTPAFLEVTIYLNDGAPDLPGDGAAVEAAPNADTNPPMLSPNTVIARTRIPGPTYPAGGVGRGDAFVNDFVINFAFAGVLVPEKFTVAIVNLDHNGNPDVTYGVDPITRLPLPTPPDPDGPGPLPVPQQPSFRFGTWQDVFQIGTPASPVADPGDPEFNEAAGNIAGSIYNTNVYGDSRTGPNINRFTNNGQWNWIEYPGKAGTNPLTIWESDRNNNSGMEMTIYAIVPEPGSIVLGAMGLVAVVGLGVRKRRSA